MSKSLSSFVLLWLRLAAKIQLLKMKPTIIGVTGSAGKTSTVQAIGLVLQSKFKTKFTKKGNSETGIPFELLDIPVENYVGLAWINVSLLAIWKLLTYWPKYEVLVVEMGIDSEKPPKNMSYLLSIVQPKIGVLLNVSSVHGQNFSGPDVLKSIAQEKGKLLTSLPSNGLAVYSADHPQLETLTPAIKAELSTFSTDRKATIQLLKYDVSLEKTTYTFSYQNQEFTLTFEQQTHFKEAFGSFASAIIIADKLGIPVKKSIQTLEKKMSLFPGRMSLIPGIDNTMIIDSSYNSSLEATTAALEMLKLIKTKGRKVAILGDMRELGDRAEQDHYALAQTAAETAEVIVLIGPLTYKYCWPYLKKIKFVPHNIFTFPQAYAAAAVVPKIIHSHDLVLVKGSQNTIFLEIVVKALMAEPEKAPKLLCRQTPFWETQRKKIIEQPFLTK